MTSKLRFSPSILIELEKAKILGVRAGSDHDFTGVWIVVVEKRVFIRSWNNKSDGWFQAFRKFGSGSIHIAGGDIPVLAKQTQSKKVRESVSRAYAEKYNTKGSLKWVTGFAEPIREAATIELLPI